MFGKKELYNQLMNHKEREMRTRISLLDWNRENVIKDIEGRISDGNISIDGNSPVRRTCSLTMLVDKNITPGEEKLSDLITINKKIKIHIGLKNTTEYKEYGDIIWFNLGVYVLTDVTYMHDLDNATISITALDKMCLWSGDIAGELQEAINISYYELKKTDGSYEKKYLTFYEMIQRIAITLGKQDPGKIIINDVDQEIRRVIQKKSSGNMYFSKKDYAYLDSLDGVDLKEVTTIAQGDYLYVYEPFRPDSTQMDSYQMNLGQTITTALDLIKNQLGNYEYFFDLDGNFVFQEVKNFQSTSFTTSITTKMTSFLGSGELGSEYDDAVKPIQSVNGVDYLTDFSKTPYTFSFEDTELATSFTNTPDWKGIKNNFVVYGESGKKMLHLVIDKKPIAPSIWYVDDTKISEIVLAEEYYVGINNSDGLWGLYIDYDFNLKVKKLEGSTVPTHIFEEYFLLQDHLTEDWSKVIIENGAIKFKDEFFPDSDYYNGIVLKSQYGCECLLYSYDSFPKLMKPYRHLNFIQASDDKVYILYPNNSDRIVIEETNEKFFTEIFDATGTIAPAFIPKKEFLLLDNNSNSRVLKIDNNKRLYIDETTQTAIRENYFIPTLKGGGVNLVVYKDRLQFDKVFTRAIPYNQPWQQYLIDLGDEIVKNTPAGNEPLLPQWYNELKQFFPMIYKRNDNYWGGNWLKAYTSGGVPIYDGMGDTAIWPYYFDMIDENTELGKYSVSNIGLRTKAIVDEDITMLYPPIRKNYIVLKPSETRGTELIDWLAIREQPYLIIKEDSEYEKNFSYAAYGKDAFTKLRELVYLHTSLNETVNISSLPLYFLEPNTKIIASDKETFTSGDYVILNISLPLQFDAQQQMSCIKLGSRL